MSQVINTRFEELRRMKGVILKNLTVLNDPELFEETLKLIFKYITKLNDLADLLNGEENAIRYKRDLVNSHISWLKNIIDTRNDYAVRIEYARDYDRLLRYRDEMLPENRDLDGEGANLIETEPNDKKFNAFLKELSDYLNPFKGTQESFSSNAAYYFFRFLQFLQIFLIPVRLIGFVVKKIFQGLFFILRHFAFWGAKDDDKDLNAFQRVIKEIGEGVDNFLSRNTEFVTRPLESLVGIIRAVADFCTGPYSFLKNVFLNLLNEFDKHPVRTITEVILFIASIVVSVVVPIALGAAASAVVPTAVPRHCAAIPAAVASAAAGHAVTPVVALAAVNTLNTIPTLAEAKQLEQKLEYYREILSCYDPVEDKADYDALMKVIQRDEVKLDNLKNPTLASKRQAYTLKLEEKIQLLQDNLAFFSPDEDADTYAALQKKIASCKAELEMIDEVTQFETVSLHTSEESQTERLLSDNLGADFAEVESEWKKHYATVSAGNSLGMFSVNSDVASSEQETPSLIRSLSMSDFTML